LQVKYKRNALSRESEAFAYVESLRKQLIDRTTSDYQRAIYKRAGG